MTCSSRVRALPAERAVLAAQVTIEDLERRRASLGLPASSSSSVGATTVTGMPEFMKLIAMPPPIVPMPTTPAVWIGNGVASMPTLV